MGSEYYAVVDMGSNGIRCSISDLTSPTSRVLPTIYQERSDISLFNVQYHDGNKIPIPEAVIDEILILLSNFKRTCNDFAVPDQQVRLVATEATRNATNSETFLERIKEEVGLDTELLSKEEESRYGGMGILSSVNRDAFEGLVLDMGGGSVQLMWMQKKATGEVKLSCCRSFPYGAAALMAQISAFGSLASPEPFTKEMSKEFISYFEQLRAAQPRALEEAAIKGLPMFVSGGGFRSWGHVLMTIDPVQPYPIPIVNGYTVSGNRLTPNLADHSPKDESHRISSRRDSQIPAIQFLIRTLLESLQGVVVSSMTFCQGGVREGLLFDILPEAVRSQNALTAASDPFAHRSSSELSAVLSSALPGCGQHHKLIPAIVNMLYFHCSHPKDIKTSAALRSTTTGALASAHGLSHYDRAILALVLCERWGGRDEVPLCDKDFLANLESLVGATATWWARYLGCISKGIADIYPAGIVSERLVEVVAESMASTLSIRITMSARNVANIAQRWAKQLRKLGKRKRWASDANACYGLEVDVIVDIRDLPFAKVDLPAGGI